MSTPAPLPTPRLLMVAALACGALGSGWDGGPQLGPLDRGSKVGLRDDPVGCSAVRYLDSSDGVEWRATSAAAAAAATRGDADGSGGSSNAAHLEIAANVPGDIISDLHAAGLVGNPLYETNFRNNTLWQRDWTYAANFTLTSAEAAAAALLVFDGVKMGATVSLNGVALANATDQFVRWLLPVRGVAVEGVNHVTVAFDASIACDTRWSACSGGWDWAPYSDTQQEGAATFSKGIWKSVYIASLGDGEAAVTHLVPHTAYLGPHPTSALTDATKASFHVRARVHLWAPAATTVVVTVAGEWGQAATATVRVPQGDSNVTLVVPAPASDVTLWWPRGSGPQALHNVTVTLAKAGGGGDSDNHGTRSEAPSSYASSTRRIGFRTVALVTGNDTDPGYVQRAENEEGTERHGMYLRVNGALVFARGANMVPMDELEGWWSAEAHAAVVSSAAAANHNMVRVWGGGAYLPQVFYDKCDEFGVLIYHDVMYAQGGHPPKATPTQEAELRHQVRRLSHHPSIVIVDGCNECTVVMTDPATSIYATFVMRVVGEEDSSRPIWPSCPATGWSTGVHRLNSTFNGRGLTTPDNVSTRCTQIPGSLCIEVHRPKWLGSGFTAVNGYPSLEPGHANMPWPWLWHGEFPPEIPLSLQPAPLGPQWRNNFSSESPGATVMSSFESMSPTLRPDHWGLHGGAPEPKSCVKKPGNNVVCDGDNVMSQRNYPCDSEILVFFGNTSGDLNSTGEAAFKRQLFYCMISQALVIKQNVETTRSQNRFGTLVWQLNEIWPTGGWGSLEYGNSRFPGQVVGGRWKPLHYWYRESLFADVLATCDPTGLCYIRNDGTTPFQGTATITFTKFDQRGGLPEQLASHDVNLAAGAGVIEWFRVPELTTIDGTLGVVQATVTAKGGDSAVSSNLVPFVTPAEMKLLPSSVAVVAGGSSLGSWTANVTCDAVALFVTLTTLAPGTFDSNAVLVHPPGRVFQFYPANSNRTAAAYDVYASSLRVEDVAAYRSFRRKVRSLGF